MLLALGPFAQFFANVKMQNGHATTTVTSWSHIDAETILFSSAWYGSMLSVPYTEHISSPVARTLASSMRLVTYTNLIIVTIELAKNELFTISRSRYVFTNGTTVHCDDPVVMTGPATFTYVYTKWYDTHITCSLYTTLSPSMHLIYATTTMTSSHVTAPMVGTISKYVLVTLTLPRVISFGEYLKAVFSGSDSVGFCMTGNIYDDSGMGYLYAHRSSPKLIFPKTDTSKVSPTGQPTWSGYTHLVTVGGRNANPTTRYYEDNGLAPLKWAGNSTHAMIMRGSEAKLNVPLSSLGSTNDYFVMQAISDGTHKAVILWGITQYGTYASGVYFDGMFADMSSLTAGWYIIRWQDLNSNSIPDYPAEFTMVASGT